MTARVRAPGPRISRRAVRARRAAFGFVIAAAALAARDMTAAGPAASRPSRKPVKGCVWERISDAGAGLEAWVQRCDFGFRKIDFLFQGKSLAIRYSDGGGAPDPLVDVFDLAPGETPDAGIRRIFREKTDPTVAARCVLAPYRGSKAPSGVRRWTFVPDAAYAKELAAKADPNEVGDPSCGDWGDAPDGIQYFETHGTAKARKVLFVRVGQDEPLFDERTLWLIEAKGE